MVEDLSSAPMVVMLFIMGAMVQDEAVKVISGDVITKGYGDVMSAPDPSNWMADGVMLREMPFKRSYNWMFEVDIVSCL